MERELKGLLRGLMMAVSFGTHAQGFSCTHSHFCLDSGLESDMLVEKFFQKRCRLLGRSRGDCHSAV